MCIEEHIGDEFQISKMKEKKNDCNTLLTFFSLPVSVCFGRALRRLYFDICAAVNNCVLCDIHRAARRIRAYLML
jgi:hypothetical protein